MKIVFVGFVILTACLTSFLAYRYSQDTYNAQEHLNQERYMRIVAEEEIEKANQNISRLSAEVDVYQNKIKGIELLLEQTKKSNSNLKDEKDQALKKNEALKAKIKELEQKAAKIAAETVAGSI